MAATKITTRLSASLRQLPLFDRRRVIVDTALHSVDELEVFDQIEVSLAAIVILYSAFEIQRKNMRRRTYGPHCNQTGSGSFIQRAAKRHRLREVNGGTTWLSRTFLIHSRSKLGIDARDARIRAVALPIIDAAFDVAVEEHVRGFNEQAQEDDRIDWRRESANSRQRFALSQSLERVFLLLMIAMTLRSRARSATSMKCCRIRTPR